MVIGTYIHEFPEEKRKERRFRILGKYSFRNHCGYFTEDSTKKHKHKKLGIGKFLTSSFPLFSAEMPGSKKKRAGVGESLFFKPLPPPLPHHPTEVPQQVQTPLSFRTDYLGKGVE